MWFTKVLSPYGVVRRFLNTVMRKFVNFLWYDCFELLMILVFVALFLLIWNHFFWR